MPTIILNATNISNYGYGNNKLVYQFQGGGVTFKENDIALAQASIYFSWFNINSSLYNNGKFAYTWVDGTTNVVNIPDGYYNVASLNAYLHSVLVTNKHYYVNVASGDFVYLMQFEENPTYYAVQFNAYLSALPAQFPAIYTYPVGALWVVPAVPTTPQLIVYPYTTSNFGAIIGFTAGSYPSVFPYTTGTYSVTSNTTPQVQPISAVIITCSLITNPYSSNSKALYSFGIPSTSFGQQILITPPEFTFNRITNGTYNEFSVEIQDQNGIPIQLKDPQMTILLTIKDRGTNQ